MASPREWPGVQMVGTVLGGKPLTGTWFNRTQEYAARLRGESFTKYQYATQETVVLSPLPCWRHLSPEKYRERVEALVQEIEAEAAAECRRTGVQPLGASAIFRQSPQSWPSKTKKSPAPGFHAATKAARRELWEAYGRFLTVFREASERLRGGDRTARFPIGSFPPGLPFVRLLPEPGSVGSFGRFRLITATSPEASRAGCGGEVCLGRGFKTPKIVEDHRIGRFSPCRRGLQADS